ncbi:MAG: chemotaxis protein CheD [Bacteroidetes bacterium]|nr:chemotaxis protein CheD [Bacteroidota bacterium]
MKQQVKIKMLNINEMDVSDQPVVFTCYGLGSCIGLFMSDRTKGLSGGVHIPLPHNSAQSDWKDATYLIDELLHAFQAWGSDLNTLRAKVTGGAQVYGSHCSIGAENAEVVLKQLIDRKVYIAATDVGGTISRTARYYSQSGELEISTSEQTKYSI